MANRIGRRAGSVLGRNLGMGNGKALAAAMVSEAIRHGRIVHPTRLKCADCGDPAIEYEHRDYNRPLDVSATCRRCNLRRGPAIPHVGCLRMTVLAGQRPYRLRRSVVTVLTLMGLPTDRVACMPTKLTVEHWHELLPLFDAWDQSRVTAGPGPQCAAGTRRQSNP